MGGDDGAAGSSGLPRKRRVAKDAESLAKMLREGARSYRKVESSIAKGFS